MHVSTPTDNGPRVCALCGRRFPLHRLIRVSWVAEGEHDLDAGVCCASCWRDLPERVDGQGVVWLLLARAP